ncbi:hypothetical protein D3C78_1336630 [compost metagenome]
MQLLEQSQAFAGIGRNTHHAYLHAGLEFLSPFGHVLGKSFFPSGQEQQAPAVWLLGHCASVVRAGLTSAVAQHVHGIPNHPRVALVNLVQNQQAIRMGGRGAL